MENKKSKLPGTILILTIGAIAIAALLWFWFTNFGGTSKQANTQDDFQGTTAATTTAAITEAQVPVTTEVTDSNDSSQSDSDGWNYEFDSAFIEENGIEYIWERLDEDTRINLGEMMNAIRNGAEYCNLSVGVLSSEKSDFLKLVTDCCTFYTWVGSEFDIGINDSGLIVTVLINYRGIDDVSDIDSVMENLENKLQEVVSAMPDGSEFEKLMYLHDYLVLNCKSGSTKGENWYSAYGALLEGGAYSDGYSAALHLLLDRAGFETVITRAVTANGSSHKWNYVKCEDGHWHVIDSLWDDPVDIGEPNYVSYDYFLVSDEEILKVHDSKSESIYYETPYADSMDMSYFNVMGYCASNEDEAYDILLEQAKVSIDDERRCLYVKFDNADEMNEIYQSLKSSKITTVIETANKSAGTSYETYSWLRTFNEEQGILVITLKESTSGST